MMRTLIMAAALMAASTGAGLAQDVAKGANSSKNCSPCHNIGPGARNKIGPELNAIASFPLQQQLAILPTNTGRRYINNDDHTFATDVGEQVLRRRTPSSP